MNMAGEDTGLQYRRITKDGDIVAARQLGRSIAESLGFSRPDQALVATAISELARNIVNYAGEGEIQIAVIHGTQGAGIRVCAMDHGPGIEDISKAMQDGFSTGKQPGTRSAWNQAHHGRIRNFISPGRRRACCRDQVVRPLNQGVLDKHGGSISWAVEQRSKHPGSASGDGYLLRYIGPVLLAAVADGTGSGTAAAKAANQCLRCLSEAERPDLHQIFANVHQALEGTRGAALGVALISPDALTLEWAAIGDIDGVLRQGSSRSESMIQRGGTLGLSFRGLLPQKRALKPPAVILLVSDGISRSYRSKLDASESAEDLARNTVLQHGRSNDDAIALALKIGAAQ